MKEALNIPKLINIYVEGRSSLDYNTIKNFIWQNFGKIETCITPLKRSVIRTKGILLDLVATQKTFEDIIKDYSACHIVVTDRIFATIGEDRRIHIRAGIYSNPSLISTKGIVEGPAKPKEFYIYKQRYSSLGIWELKIEEVKRRLKGQFIDYDDKRLNEVIKGYFAQALFFYITGNPFCDRRSCRLYNAHWQKDLIFSQIKSGTFCSRHKKELEKIKKEND